MGFVINDALSYYRLASLSKNDEYDEKYPIRERFCKIGLALLSTTFVHQRQELNAYRLLSTA